MWANRGVKKVRDYPPFVGDDAGDWIRVRATKPIENPWPLRLWRGAFHPFHRAIEDWLGKEEG